MPRAIRTVAPGSARSSRSPSNRPGSRRGTRPRLTPSGPRRVAPRRARHWRRPRRRGRLRGGRADPRARANPIEGGIPTEGTTGARTAISRSRPGPVPPPSHPRRPPLCGGHSRRGWADRVPQLSGRAARTRWRSGRQQGVVFAEVLGSDQPAELAVLAGEAGHDARMVIGCVGDAARKPALSAALRIAPPASSKRSARKSMSTSSASGAPSRERCRPDQRALARTPGMANSMRTWMRRRNASSMFFSKLVASTTRPS